MILLFAMRPFEVGDVISMDDQRYIVKKINLLTTWMTDKNNIMYVWSNDELLHKKMNNFVNYTQTGESRHSLVFYVPITVDTKQIEKVVMHDFAQSVTTEMPQDCGNVSMSIDWFETSFSPSKWKVEVYVVSYIPFDDSRAVSQARTKLWQLLQHADREQKLGIKKN